VWITEEVRPAHLAALSHVNNPYLRELVGRSMGTRSRPRAETPLRGLERLGGDPPPPPRTSARRRTARA
jgi:hypothetical protein